MKIFATLLTASLGLAMTVPAHAAPPSVDAADYPALDAKEVGHVRHIMKLARQLPGDWSGMGTSWWMIGERAAQFELGYMAAYLALAQYKYTPAYREPYQAGIHALIQKMTLPDVWERWLDISRGGKNVDPDQDELMHGSMDPVAKNNIMLKGYLLQSAALYDVLYRDGVYDKPDAFTFKYLAGTWGNGPVTFRYSLPDLAQIVHQEYAETNYIGVQCEPNRIFPTCNHPPILGLLNFDQSHGTSYAADVMPKFKQKWVDRNYVDPTTKNMAALIYVKQDKVIPNAGLLLEGWAYAWMNAWDPDYVQSLYPSVRDAHAQEILTGAYAKAAAAEGSPGAVAFGHMIFMAAEVGDQKMRDTLLAYAERNFNPVWQNGEYYYPRSDDWSVDKDGNTHGVDTWTGNALIPLARLDKGNDFRKLYQNPWTDAHFKEPFISDVDYLTTNVSQAVYDANKQALVVTLMPGPVKAAKISFKVRQLDPAKTYSVLKDKKPAGRLERAADGTASLSTDLSSAHSFVIVAN